MDVEAVMKRVEEAIAVQQGGDRDAARQQFAELWGEIGPAGDPLCRCRLAHHMADVQDDLKEELTYNRRMPKRATVLRALGDEAGCQRLSAAFYARVGKDPVLRPLFPGKSLRCATEEFAAFLIQFLGGDEEHTQHRWWLSLRESHARFRIGPAERRAWLKHMAATLEATPLDEPTRTGPSAILRAEFRLCRRQRECAGQNMMNWRRVGVSSAF